MFVKGFRFGLLLQIAIGPVCLYVLKVAVESGIMPAISATAAATIIDGLFAALAIAGIAPLLDKPKTKKNLKRFGTLILTYFGCGIILSKFGINIIPGIGGAAITGSSSAFAAGLILTAANPLTILFWAGVFATKISEGENNKKDIILFASGAVSTTLVFLGALTFAASLARPLLTHNVILILNLFVGAALLIFAFRMLFRSEPETASAVK